MGSNINRMIRRHPNARGYGQIHHDKHFDIQLCHKDLNRKQYMVTCQYYYTIIISEYAFLHITLH